MRDPYAILGVASSASQDEIKKAYRRLAKKLHPDRHHNDAKIAERFKEVAAAYQIVGNAEQRARFDRGEIDASGRERMARGFHPGGAGAGFGGYGGRAAGSGHDAFGGTSPEDLFGEFFSGFKRSGRKSFTARGKNRKYSLNVDFVEAALGGTRRIQLNGGKTLDVRIPAGIDDGQQIRLKGQGEPGRSGGEAGDALVEVKVLAHSLFSRKGSDVHMELPVSLPEAVLGAKITVPTIAGEVALTVPRGSSSGTTLRLKGKGIPGRDRTAAGDQLVKIRVVLPPKPDLGLEKIIEEWSHKNLYSARPKDFGKYK